MDELTRFQAFLEDAIPSPSDRHYGSSEGLTIKPGGFFASLLDKQREAVQPENRCPHCNQHERIADLYAELIHVGAELEEWKDRHATLAAENRELAQEAYTEETAPR